MTQPSIEEAPDQRYANSANSKNRWPPYPNRTSETGILVQPLRLWLSQQTYRQAFAEKARVFLRTQSTSAFSEREIIGDAVK
jgi:hypothetical protein